MLGAWCAGCLLGASPFPTESPVPALDGRWLAPPLILATALTRSPTMAIAATAAMLPAGWLAGAAATEPTTLLQLRDRPEGLAGPWEVGARIAREPEPGRDGARLWLDVDRVRIDGSWRPLDGRVEVSLPRTGHALLPGAGVEAFLSLRTDRPPSNPGAPYRDRLLGRGVAARASLKSPEQLRLRRPATALEALPARVRAAVRTAIGERFDGQARALVPALLLGERGEVPDALGTRMAVAGLAHLLSVSGLHVGLLAGIAVLLVRALGGSPRLAAGAGVAAAAAMALLVVPRPPVQRAALMAAAVLGGTALDRRVGAADALAGSVMLLTWWQPAVVGDLGFQLTVAATAGIVLLAPPTSSGRGSRIVAALAVPLAAQAAVAPIIAAQAGALPLAGVPLNLAAVPLLAASMPLLIATVALQLCGASGMAMLVAWISEHLLVAITGLAGLTDGAQAAIIAVPSSGPLLALAWWSNLLLWRRTRIALIPLAVIGGLALRAPAAPTPRLIVLDVGQGDAVLVQSGDEALLVDAGGFPGLDWSTGSHVVAPALHRLGVRHLRAVSVSHAHADHAAGVPGVLAALPTRELWLGANPAGNALQRALLDAAVERRVVALAPNAPVNLGGCSVRTLVPDVALLLAGATEVTNDASLVHAVTCGRHVLLLTGDAGGLAEPAWATTIRRGAVLKVGHHGSRSATSAAMIAALRPGIAIISAGAGNTFGLPADDVVRRLYAGAIPVYRTDRDGALVVELGERRRVRGLRWSAGDGRPGGDAGFSPR